LDEQTKEIEADKAAEAGLAQQAGQPGQPPTLAKMANEMLPGAKLYNDDGSLTQAGEINQSMVQATKLAKQAKSMSLQANLIEDNYQRSRALGESRLFGRQAQIELNNAREMRDKIKNDSIYTGAMATNQSEYDASLKAYQDSGLPLPQGIPTEYSPENVKKIAALAPAALQSKINNDIIKRNREIDEDRIRKLNIERKIAKGLSGDGDGGQTKITAEIDKRLSTAEIGLKNSNRIETILSDPKASKALDNSQFLRSLLETPKELGSVEKYVKSNLYQSLPKESQDLVSLIVKMRNDYYRQTSGQAVTGGEAARNFFAVVQPTDNTETLLRKIRGQKVDYSDALSNAVDDYKMPATRKSRLKALVESNQAEKTSAEAGGGASSDAMRAQAQAAIAAGAPKDAVAKMYKEKTGKDF
jgi:hypothetical protein